jgi:hypothetical protein
LRQLPLVVVLEALQDKTRAEVQEVHKTTKQALRESQVKDLLLVVDLDLVTETAQAVAVAQVQ